MKRSSESLKGSIKSMGVEKKRRREIKEILTQFSASGLCPVHSCHQREKKVKKRQNASEEEMCTSLSVQT